MFGQRENHTKTMSSTDKVNLCKSHGKPIGDHVCSEHGENLHPHALEVNEVMDGVDGFKIFMDQNGLHWYTMFTSLKVGEKVWTFKCGCFYKIGDSNAGKKSITNTNVLK